MIKNFWKRRNIARQIKIDYSLMNYHINYIIAHYQPLTASFLDFVVYFKERIKLEWNLIKYVYFKKQLKKKQVGE